MSCDPAHAMGSPASNPSHLPLQCCANTRTPHPPHLNQNTPPRASLIVRQREMQAKKIVIRPMIYRTLQGLLNRTTDGRVEKSSKGASRAPASATMFKRCPALWSRVRCVVSCPAFARLRGFKCRLALLMTYQRLMDGGLHIAANCR